MSTMLPILVMVVLVLGPSTHLLVEGKEKAGNRCESTDELKFCEKQCKKDPDCNEDTNLSCNAKCKEACYILDKKFGTRERLCKQVLHATIQYNRKPDIIPEGAEGYYIDEEKTKKRPRD